jgi:hypothetical protein
MMLEVYLIRMKHLYYPNLSFLLFQFDLLYVYSNINTWLVAVLLLVFPSCFEISYGHRISSPYSIRCQMYIF